MPWKTIVLLDMLKECVGLIYIVESTLLYYNNILSLIVTKWYQELQVITTTQFEIIQLLIGILETLFFYVKMETKFFYLFSIQNRLILHKLTQLSKKWTHSGHIYCQST